MIIICSSSFIIIILSISTKKSSFDADTSRQWAGVLEVPRGNEKSLVCECSCPQAGHLIPSSKVDRYSMQKTLWEVGRVCYFRFSGFDCILPWCLNGELFLSLLDYF